MDCGPLLLNLKLSPFIMDKIQTILYALAYVNSGSLLLVGILEFFYDEYIESRMLQIIRKSHKDRQVRQELYQANQI
ncbi:hypothetical protein AbaMCR56_15775 [Acinetobacter baumannii]|nr:hypothetical protein AbaMCR56_15775 [Acinetobacter baumannii]